MGYMNELAEAADYLNEPRHPSGDGKLVGVQHRDIKPHNVFLVGGSARLADFGLAKVLEASSAEHTGGMSPYYAAPEMIQGHVSPRTDQYSLAVTYVHLRTGRLPFAGATVHTVLYGHVHELPDLPGLPEAERSAVARALAKSPADRWPDCRGFVRALDEATEPATGMTPPCRIPYDPATLQPTTERQSTDPKAAQAPRRRSIRMGSIVGVVLASLVALAIFVRPSPIVSWPVPVATIASADPGPPGNPPAAVPPATPGRPMPPVVRPVAFVPPVPADDELAGKARAVMVKYCHNCHGVKFEKPPLDVLDKGVLLARPPAGGKRSSADVVPGDPDGSLIWKRVGIEEDMPPEDPTPSDDEKATLRRWIAAGAPFIDAPTTRPFVAEKAVLTAIRDDLMKTSEIDRPYRRYFTLTNLHNDRKVSDDDVTLARAGLAKLANSLSWKPKIVVPRAVDADRVVYAVDLRDLGWDRDDVWRRLIRNESAPKGKKYEGARDELRKGYPYGRSHATDPDAEVRRIAADVYRLAGTQLPAIRVDWFLATASRPPLYEEILGLPDHARELERRLDVEAESNFLRDRVARAGFGRSGVSSHNRMVERHDASYGAYWKSYDFRLDEGTAALARLPLGPAFAANPYSRLAFEHAGGELIFNLPNGLQGYLLVDAAERTIAAGPIDVVGDALKTSGTAAIVNGLSCMACHKDGMIAEFADEIRAGHAVGGEARDKVERVYPEKAAMDRLLDEDAGRFLAALEKATGAILKVGPDKDKPIRDFPEPIGTLARLYHKDLGPDAAAADLGLEGMAGLQAAIRANPELRRLGLGPLLQVGGTIKRSAWESLKFLNTPFQDAAAQLRVGTPTHEF